VAARATPRWQAAELFDRADEAPRALALLQRVQADPASPLPQVVQSRWRLAEAARRAGKQRDEQALLRALLQADAQGGEARTDATRTLAARAALRLAEPQLLAYRQVTLVEPLKTTLARKKTRFDALQALYTEVAAMGSAEAQALALEHSAALYQDFGRAVLASQRPRGLGKADAAAYQRLLEEQARPFEDKAAELLRLKAERSAPATAQQAAANATEARR
jgi:cellulose synthase operon protein C